ncbi:hypothetical protein QBC47DRAFT_430514 [Echria macrotheca]|uniref:Uncharacterized protein n=1 Tax=Echria macrotheca TaxID=438768 RepID=A0AAJ0BBG5_9PEZI|nr:hypothetical protein QBC47DRAFT_430514 [Echria macrotheca]
MAGRLLVVLLSLSVAGPVHGHLTGDEKTVEDAFPPLNDLKTPDPLSFQAVGGQNFTRCCLKAVRATYDIVDGKLGFTPNPANRFLTQTPQELSDLEFPCGAKYDGNDNGAPLVQVPYHWCAENCPGWQQSVNGDLDQWIIPFVGFILPAAVFCLGIPRRRLFTIPDDLFPNHLDQLQDDWVKFVRALLDALGVTTDTTPGGGMSATKDGGVMIHQPPDRTKLVVEAFVCLIRWFGYAIIVGVEMTIRASIAATIAFSNTILWVAMVFITAAPMMLSGLYEAMVDRNILDAIIKNRKWNSIRGQKAVEVAEIKREVHLLYAILVGNISLPPESEPEDHPDAEAKPTAWGDVLSLVKTLGANPTDQSSPEVSKEVNKSAANASRLRLHTMLECQVSFGATVGAPIVFFLGAFLVSIFSSLLEIGNNDTAHTIAFGEWWMTIPHVAVVAGCLLAGNNPNTLEAIMSGFPHVADRDHDNTLNERFQGFRLVKKFVEFFSPMYDSIYQPVWMWDRGRNKELWIKRIQNYHNELKKKAANGKEVTEKNGTPTPDSKPPKKGFWERIKKKLVKRVEKLSSKYLEKKDVDATPLPDDIPDIDVEDWINLILTVVVLLLIPFILAFLTSYHTPLVGLSCRSFTFTLYFLFQFWLGVLWFYDFTHDKHVPLYFTWKGYRLPTPFTLLVVFGLLGSGFTAMVGTFLQILGVYRNCLCKLPIQYWSAPRDVLVVLSTDMGQSIEFARQYWLSTGIASIVLLIVVCYLGWWYQRHWRMRFEKVVVLVLPKPKEGKSEGHAAPAAPATPVVGEVETPKGEETKPVPTVGEDEIAPVPASQ